MATPTGNSPSFPASTQGCGRNNKTKLEDYPPTYEQYLQLKNGFLSSHAHVCDICRSLTYGSRVEPQLDYACDSHLKSLTETQVGDMIIGHLDALYRKVIKDLSSNYGYPEADATTAVLATGICYGCEDPIGNSMKHALTFLKCGLRVDKPKKQNFSEELKTLAKFVSIVVYNGWRKKHPYFCMDDLLFWLLVYRTDPSDASRLASYPFGTLRSHKISSSSTCLQWKEESTSNTPTIQFMPVAGVIEDDKLGASSTPSKNASERKLTTATCIPDLTSGRFTARTSLSLPISNPNAVKKNPMSLSDSLVDKFSALTISESSIPEEKSKDADSCRRVFPYRLPERRRQARIIGTERKLVNLTNHFSESAKSITLDSNCFLPESDETVGLESSQSFATKIFSLDVGTFAGAPFSMNIVNTTKCLSHVANVDAFTSIPSKSSSDASIPFVLEDKLHCRVEGLQLQLQYWTNWAQHKVLQTTNKLNKDKAELQSLRQEKLEAEMEKAAFTDSTMKKIGEMGEALSRARTQVQAASAATCKLEFEKNRLKEKLEAAKIHASESAANSQEASLKEIMALKESQTCERERSLFQEELVSKKRMLPQLQKQLQQAQMSHGRLEVITSWFIVCYFFLA